ncbi:DNA-directed RNA polymerase alpha subunit [Paraburkholderia sp. JPY465]|uniref:DNA-directed RNA polymerase subunit alpha C-terminal domain-containing protein n=1 Tax=Paraburkholderia sp. JPY465 TaxID=3042285 RepID=UPI003D21015D
MTDLHELANISQNLRVANRLGASGICRLEKLCARSAKDLLQLPGFGPRSLVEVRDALAQAGRTLRADGPEVA